MTEGKRVAARYLSMRELSDRWGQKSSVAVTKLVADGVLPYLEVGRSKMIYIGDVEDYEARMRKFGFDES